MNSSGPSQGFSVSGSQRVAASGSFIAKALGASAAACCFQCKAESETGQDTNHVQPAFPSFQLLQKVFGTGPSSSLLVD